MSLKYLVVRRNRTMFPGITATTYLRHDQIHRTIGPAEIWSDGEMFWFQYDVSHRVDGPSDVFEDGIRRFFIRGVEQKETERVGVY